MDGLEREYKLILEYSGYGRICKEGFQSFEIPIETYKINEMTLMLGNFGNIYNFNLTRENEN